MFEINVSSCLKEFGKIYWNRLTGVACLYILGFLSGFYKENYKTADY